MDVSIKASGQPSKFDIFDSGLTLLALHSACLALAFTASENEAILKTFNVILMMAGFASGAVLAVLAAYYGTINAKALAPQLMGGSAGTGEVAAAIFPDSDSEQGSVGAVLREQSNEDSGLRLEPVTTAGATPFSWSAPGRSTGVVAGVVLVLLVLVMTLLLQGVAKNNKEATARVKQAESAESVAAAELLGIVAERRQRSDLAERRVAATGETMNEATRSSLAKNAAEVDAEKKASETKLAADQARQDASDSSDWKRALQAWLIIGLTALVLAPIPFAWTAPSPLVSTVRGLLVLGSLLAFVLGVGGALLPLAAQAVSKGVEQATETRVDLPGTTNHPGGVSTTVQIAPATNGPINLVQPGHANRDPEGENPGGSPLHPDIEGIRTDIAQLKADMSAALSRPVQMQMDAPAVIRVESERPPLVTQTPPPPINLTVTGTPGKQGEQGEQGEQGAPGLVRRCSLQGRWPIVNCRWTTAGDVESPAPLPPF